MKYNIRIEQVDAQPLAVVRRRASPSELSKVVPDACGLVWNTVKALNLTGAGRHIAVYLDAVINLEVGVELPSPFVGHGDVIASTTPSGFVATTVHLGPYHRLGDAHTAVREWCADQKLELAGPNWEIYGHWTDDPAKVQTDVFYLLQSAGRS